METKSFDCRAVLTVITGRLLTKNGIGDLYHFLNWMTGEMPFTHQIPRFMGECKPWLLRWFPELAPCGVSLHKLDEWIKRAPTCPEEGIRMWYAEQKLMFPEIKDTYDVPRIPQHDHEFKNCYDELVEMRGTYEGIILVGDLKPEEKPE